VAAAALVPATVFGAAQLDAAAAADAHGRALFTGHRLALAAEHLDVAAAMRLLTRTPLAGGERLLLRAPSGTLLPESVAADLARLPYVEVPLKGALLGGSLRVIYAAQPMAHGPLLAVALTLLMVTLITSAIVSRSVAEDAHGVTQQIERVARGDEPGMLGEVVTFEVGRVTLAVNHLLERIPRLTVESFLAIERAREAERLKSQFLANMSHDLRSPLNSILGFSELLLRGLEGAITPQQRDALSAMHSTGQHLLRLLNEILDTAKAESGRMELHRQSTQPAELVRQASQEARRGRPAEVSDQLRVELQPGLGPIYVDPLRLTQAVTHLLNYALDAAQGGEVMLRAREGDLGRTLVVDVEHAGALTDEERSRLFDGFRQVTGKPGLHLALPLARRLLELHGGTLELGPGSRPHLRAVVPLGRRQQGPGWQAPAG
jgi:signal transduction histidine kinase